MITLSVGVYVGGRAVAVFVAVRVAVGLIVGAKVGAFVAVTVDLGVFVGVAVPVAWTGVRVAGPGLPQGPQNHHRRRANKIASTNKNTPILR